MLNLAMGVLKKHKKIDDGDRHFHVVVVHAEMHIADIGYSRSFQVIGALLPHDHFGVWKPFIFFSESCPHWFRQEPQSVRSFTSCTLEDTKWEVTKTCRALKHGTRTPIHTTMSAICMKAHNDIKWSQQQQTCQNKTPRYFQPRRQRTHQRFPSTLRIAKFWRIMVLVHSMLRVVYYIPRLWKTVSGCIVYNLKPGPSLRSDLMHAGRRPYFAVDWHNFFHALTTCTMIFWTLSYSVLPTQTKRHCKTWEIQFTEVTVGNTYNIFEQTIPWFV